MRSICWGYYQFTYEKNKVKGIASDDESTWASPAWIYRMYCGGVHNIEKVYDILEQYGPLSWTDDPYDINENNKVDLGMFPDNSDAMIREMEYRVIERVLLYFDSSKSQIKSPESTILNAVKQELANENTLAISTLAGGWINVRREDGVIVTVRGGNKLGTGHAMVLVGYDDTFYYDINGNGKREAGEYGAFKVANSWGTGYGNDGYYWVMYDALNTISSVENNPWDNYNVAKYGERVGIFTRESDFSTSTFRKIVVGKTNCEYMMQFSIDGNHMDCLKLVTSCRLQMQESTNLISLTGNCVDIMFDAGDVSYNGEWVVALDIMADHNLGLDSKVDYIDYIIINEFYVSDNEGKYEKLSEITSNIVYEIVDNKGNILSAKKKKIVDGESIECNSLIMLDARGDVNFDQIVNASDAQLVLEVAAGARELSKLQKFYADVNTDGIVNAEDARLILQIASGMSLEEATKKVILMQQRIMNETVELF